MNQEIEIDKPRIRLDAQYNTNLPVLLGVNERRIMEIKAQSKDLVISDTKTYEATKQLRTEAVTMRTTLEKKRKEVGEPHRQKLNEINDEAKRLNSLILEVEQPLQETVRAWEAKKEQEKREREQTERRRIENIKNNIAMMNSHVMNCTGKSSEFIKTTILCLEALDPDSDSWQEFKAEARATYDHAVSKLNELLTATLAYEERLKAQEAERKRLVAEREEMELRRKEHEEKMAFEREALATINTYKNFPSLLLHKDLPSLQNLFVSLKRKEPKREELKQYYDEALAAFNAAVTIAQDAITRQMEIDQKQKEEQRIKGIKQSIHWFSEAVISCHDRDSDYIREQIGILEEAGMVTEQKFQEFYQEALTAREKAVMNLQVLLEGVSAYEAREMARQQQPQPDSTEQIIDAEFAEVDEYPEKFVVLLGYFVPHSKGLKIIRNGQFINEISVQYAPLDWVKEQYAPLDWVKERLEQAYQFGLEDGKLEGKHA